MSRTLGDLLLRVGADLASFNQLRGQLDSTKNAIGDFAAKAEALSLNFERAFTGPIEKAGEALLKLSEDFKEGTNTIIRQTGAVGDELAGLQKSFSNVFGSVDESAQEVSNALSLLSNRFGLTGEALETLTKTYLDFHDAVGGDTNATIEATVKLFSQWSIATGDQTEKMTELMRISQAAAEPVQKIEELLTQFGPALREAGIGFDQAALMIGNLAKAGVDVAPTLQGISKALATMTKAGLTEPLEGLQLLAQKIKDAATEGEAFAIGATAFGKGAASMVSAIREGRISFEDFAGTLKLNNNTIDEVAAKVKTLSEKWAEAWKGIKLAFAPIADDLVAAVEDLLQAAKPLLDWVVGLAKSFSELDPSTKKLIFGFLGIVAAIGPLAGLVAGVAFAFETLAGVMASAAAIIGPVLVPALVAVGAALAVWGLSKAISEVSQLDNNIRSLKDQLAAGKQATDDEAGSIALLESAIAKYNAQIANRVKIDVPKYDPAGNVLAPSQYIANMNAALDKAGVGLKTAGQAFGTFTGELFDASGKLKPFTDLTIDLGDATEEAGKKAKGFGANTKAAVDKVLEAFSPMKQIEEQIKKMQEIVGAQSLPIKQLQLTDLQRRALAPTAADADTTWSEYLAEVVKLNRAASIQTSEETLERLADLRSELKRVGMDTQQAFNLLGLPSEADVARSVAEIQTALKRITDSQLATDNDRQRAAIASQQKLVDLWRSTGQRIVDADILTLNRLKADWEAATLDIGTAFAKLGVSSVTQVDEQLQVIDAALAKIRGSVKAGTATQLDADNAEIASLEKKASAYQSIGKAITDAEVDMLARLKTARQANSFTTEGAFQFLGIPSQQDLDNALTVIIAAFDKIAKAETTTAGQLNQARAAELGKMIEAYRKAGVQVTEDMLSEWKKRTAAAQIAALDIDQAFNKLGILSTVDARNQIDLLKAAFDKIGASAESTGTQIQMGLVNSLKGTIEAMKKAGQEIPEALLGALHEAEVQLKQMTMNLDDAFSQLGIQATESIVNSARLAKTALDQITSSESASFADRLQAQIRYNEEVYKSQVMLGEKTDEFTNAQTQLAKQRLQAALSDQYNIFLAFAKTIADIYGQVQSSIADVILGAKSLGQAFEDIGKAIEKAIVNYIVKNLLLTQGTLDKLTDSLLGLLKQLVGGFGGSGSIPGVGGPADGAVGGAGGALGNAGGSGGLLAQLSSLTNVLGLIVNVIGTIVGAIQGARMINTLGKIEENTRRMDIIMEQGDGLLFWTKSGAMDQATTKDYVTTTMHQLLVDIASRMESVVLDLDLGYKQWEQQTAILKQALAYGWGGSKDGGSSADAGGDVLTDIDGYIRAIKDDTGAMVQLLGTLVQNSTAPPPTEPAPDPGADGGTTTARFRAQLSTMSGAVGYTTTGMTALGDAVGLLPGIYHDATTDAQAEMKKLQDAAAEAFLKQVMAEAANQASLNRTTDVFRQSVGKVDAPMSELEQSINAANVAALKFANSMEGYAAAQAARAKIQSGPAGDRLAGTNGIPADAFNIHTENGTTTYNLPESNPMVQQMLAEIKRQQDAAAKTGTGYVTGSNPNAWYDHPSQAGDTRQVMFEPSTLAAVLNDAIYSPNAAAFLNPSTTRPYGLTQVPDASSADSGRLVLQSNVSGVILDDESLRKLSNLVFDQFNEMQRQAGLLR